MIFWFIILLVVINLFFFVELDILNWKIDSDVIFNVRIK